MKLYEDAEVKLLQKIDVTNDFTRNKKLTTLNY